jgi:serine/threonine protein phosphatase 1
VSRPPEGACPPAGVAGLYQSLVGRLRRAGPVDDAAPALKTRIVLTREPQTLYAIGDVHGCIEKLRRAEAAIEQDAAATPGTKLLVLLGDYIDRGHGSAEVLDHLIARPVVGVERICLCGNHEAIFLDLLDGKADFDAWLDFGGAQTLASYGIDVHYLRRNLGFGTKRILDELVRSIPERHVAFLRSLPVSVETPLHFFCHAGVRPGRPLAEQSERDLMWIRSEFLRAPAAGNLKRIVHGHTPFAEPRVEDGRISLDTGAYLGGHLTVARISGDDVQLYLA